MDPNPANNCQTAILPTVNHQIDLLKAKNILKHTKFFDPFTIFRLQVEGKKAAKIYFKAKKETPLSGSQNNI